MAGIRIRIGVWTGAELWCRRLLDFMVEVSFKKSNFMSSLQEKLVSGNLSGVMPVNTGVTIQVSLDLSGVANVGNDTNVPEG